MELKEFSLSDDIKKQLGFIVRETRKLRLIESKNTALIENNPYTKENFCENNQICHYHTLTKLENELIKEDIIYHTLLKKLNFYYQVSNDEHIQNMEYLDKRVHKLLYAGEFIDDDLAKQMKEEIQQIHFDIDIIADFYQKLLILYINLQLFNKIEYSMEELEQFVDFYEGIYQGYGLSMSRFILFNEV